MLSRACCGFVSSFKTECYHSRVRRVVGLKPGSALRPFKQTLLSSLTPSHTPPPSPPQRPAALPSSTTPARVFPFLFSCPCFVVCFSYSPLSSAAATSRAKVNILQAPCVLGADDAAILVLSGVQTSGGTKRAAGLVDRVESLRGFSFHSERDAVDKAPLVPRPVFIQPHLPPLLRPCPAPGAPLVTLTLPPCPLPLTGARNREGPGFLWPC